MSYPAYRVAAAHVARQAFLIRELSPPCNPPAK